MIIGVDRLTKDQVLELLRDSATESAVLDFKRAVPTGRGRDDIAKDVASLANGQGGRLIYGIGESDGQAHKLHPIPLADADGLVRTLLDVIGAGVMPRPVVDAYEVAMSDAECVLVVDVEQSWAGPHGLVTGNLVEFWERIPKKNREMNYDTIATAFRMRAEIPARIRSDRDQSIASLRDGPHALNGIGGFPLVQLLVQPLATYLGRGTVGVRDAHDVVMSLAPRRNSGGWYRSYDLDGVTAVQMGSTTNGAAFAKIRRDGLIEVVDATLGRGPFRGSETRWHSPAYERRFVEIADAALVALTALKVSGAVFVSLTLINWNGIALAFSDDWPDDPRPIDREVVRLPLVEVNDRSVSCATALRPAFDVLWNAFGQERALCYSDDGVPLWV